MSDAPRHASRMLGLLLVLVGAVSSAQPQSVPSASRVWSGVTIGAVGLLLASGYTAGAFATADRPSGLALGVVGGGVSLGLLGAGIGLAINAQRKSPGSMVGFVLLPILAGLGGAVLGGVLGAFGAFSPGTSRTVTHVIVVSLLIGETIAWEFVR